MIWPWRSRPVITPFRDDFSARTIIALENESSQSFVYNIPSNIYLTPVSIMMQITTIGGIRPVADTVIQFYRANRPYAISIGQPLRSNATQHHFFGANLIKDAQIGTVVVYQQPLSYPIYCYPDDTIHFTLESWIAGDVTDYVLIHAQIWEVH